MIKFSIELIINWKSIRDFRVHPPGGRREKEMPEIIRGTLEVLTESK